MKNSTIEPATVDTEENPAQDRTPLADSFDDDNDASGTLDEDQSLRAKEEQIAALQVDLDEKEENLLRCQKQKAISEEQLDTMKKELRQVQHDKSLLQSENKSLKQEVQTANLDKNEAQKKLTAKEKELENLQRKQHEAEIQTQAFSHARRKLAEAKEQDAQLQDKVEELVHNIGEAGLANGISLGFLSPIGAPKLRDYYFGDFSRNKIRQFIRYKPVSLHLEIDFRGMDNAGFPLTSECSIAANRLSGEVHILCRLKQTISGPRTEHWDCKLGGLAQGIYRIEGCLNYLKDDKPFFKPSLIDLGILIIF